MAQIKDSAIQLDKKTREALSEALDAMTEWREDVTDLAEKHGEKVFDKLGAAAKAAGWPETIIETTRSQFMQASKFQTDVMDHIQSAWREQLQSPVKLGAFSQALGQGPAQGLLQGTPPLTAQTAGIAGLPLTPAHFWIQTMKMWRRNWTDAMAPWMSNGGTQAGGSGQERH